VDMMHPATPRGRPERGSPQTLAIVAVLGTGFIHIVEARDAFSDAAYKGLLFVANGLGAVVAAFGIYRNQRALG